MVVLAVWIIAQAILFAVSLHSLLHSPQYATLRSIIGLGVLARVAAALINFNVALTLLTACRLPLHLLRRSPLNRIIPLENHICMHRATAIATAFWTVIHVATHYFNYAMIANHLRHSSPAAPSLIHSSLIDDFPTSTMDALSVTNHSLFNDWWSSVFGQQSAITSSMAVVSGPGLTGLVLVILMMLVFTGAHTRIRRGFYELFVYSHQLTVVMLLVLLFHGGFCYIPSIIRQEGMASCGTPSFK